jgi:NAD dependent epimerase/dehydratase family enzyme
VLNDDAKQGSTNTFRVNTCISIENLTQKLRGNAMIARIGHVFGHSDGIFPFIRLSSQLRIKKFEKGGQYIPWIHVEDVANAFYFMATNAEKF